MNKKSVSLGQGGREDTWWLSSDGSTVITKRNCGWWIKREESESKCVHQFSVVCTHQCAHTLLCLTLMHIQAAALTWRSTRGTSFLQAPNPNGCTCVGGCAWMASSRWLALCRACCCYRSSNTLGSIAFMGLVIYGSVSYLIIQLALPSALL